MPVTQLNRCVLSLRGEGVELFLKGLITNSLTQPQNFAALLTPQGKIVADFFVTKIDDGYLIDTPSKFGTDLLKRLKMYKLRAKFQLSDISETCFVYALWDGQGEEGLVDPRHPSLGRRLIGKAIESTASIEDYNAHRLSLGVPDSEWDFKASACFPADVNMDLLSGVDYQKGCFVGQEVVSRMHRKGSVRKRACGFSGQAQAGESLWQGEVKVGDALSCFDTQGMAIIRVDKIDFSQAATRKAGGEVQVREPVSYA